MSHFPAGARIVAAWLASRSILLCGMGAEMSPDSSLQRQFERSPEIIQAVSAQLPFGIPFCQA